MTKPEEATVPPAVGTPLEPSVGPLCSSCRFPLDEYNAGQRHYGTHTAHVEWYCIQRLRNEIDRLRGIVPEVLERLNDELCAENERLRAALELAAPALELGRDALRAEAERYHAEMAGYRPHRHQELDDDYKRADLAWQAVVAALGPNGPVEPDSTARGE